uniref:Uncharacterized protein n=1 Tax=Arundo donax TaxID=35708 RepID=A0A0A9GTC0_ARUDO
MKFLIRPSMVRHEGLLGRAVLRISARRPERHGTKIGPCLGRHGPYGLY